MAVVLRRRIDFPQVDMAGIVYYPQYWDMCHRFFEGAWPEIIGLDYPSIITKRRLGFPAVGNQCEFHAPLRYGDTVECKLWISHVGTSSLEWQYRYSNQDGLLVWSAQVTTVCVGMDDLKPCPIPEDFREGLVASGEDSGPK